MKNILFRLQMAWYCLRARRVMIILPMHKGSESVCDARIVNAPGPLVWQSIQEWATRRHVQALREADERLLADMQVVIDGEVQKDLLAQAHQLIQPR